MKLKVIKGFHDKEDDRFHYTPSFKDTYPRQGVKPSEERIAELVKGGYLEAPKVEAPKKEKAEEIKEDKPKKEKAEKPKK